LKAGKKPEAAQKTGADTVRRNIMALLSAGDGFLSAQEISGQIRIPEKDVYIHLEHIRRTARRSRQELKVLPARCNTCGFVFKKRNRLFKPGRCPVCRRQHISPPAFSLKPE